MRLGALSAFACLAMLPAAPAPAASLPPPPQVLSVDLHKARHEPLRFQWQAEVHEEGGAFVLRRRAAGARSSVERPALPVARHYEAQWGGPAESGVYELRYRDAQGAERVLLTLLLNCHTWRESEAGLVPSDSHSAPGEPTQGTCSPAGHARDYWHPALVRHAVPARRPSVPPPRAWEPVRES